MVKLDDIKPGDRVAGIEPEMLVEVLHVQKAGPDAVNVSSKFPSGHLLQKTVFRADEAKHSMSTTTSQFSYRASPEELSAEATRINQTKGLGAPGRDSR